MSDAECLVGLIAMALAISSTSIAIGPWRAPYQLHSIALVESTYGKHAARVAWLLIAVLSAGSSAAILTGLRPSYAEPSHAPQQSR